MSNNCKLLGSVSTDGSFLAKTESIKPYYKPIQASEARARTIADGYHGSLLRAEELSHYIPDEKISICIATWNVNSRNAPSDLNPIALPEKVTYLADVLAFGIQEAPQGNFIKEWEIDLQKTIGPTHVLIHSTTHGALHLCIFVKRFLIWYCSQPEDETHNTRSPCAIPILKTKGAIAVSFRIFGTSFLFINSHFPAHETQTKRRLEEYESIITSINLPKNHALLKTRYITRDLTGRFDCVFWFGDLNFRIELTHETVVQYILENKQTPQMVEYLLKHDQLRQSMETRSAFRSFNESQNMNFPPTYKFELDSNTYETVLKRVPSYTDRILYRTKRLGHIINYMYDYVPQFCTSDHKPVFALFEAQIRHGRDDIPLNLGLFDREIYIEGLKRRAIESGRKNSDLHDCVIN